MAYIDEVIADNPVFYVPMDTLPIETVPSKYIIDGQRVTVVSDGVDGTPAYHFPGAHPEDFRDTTHRFRV